MVTPPEKPIPPKVSAPPNTDEARINFVEGALKTVTSCCQTMKETTTKQATMIDTLTNLIKTQNTTFTKTLDRVE